MNRCRVVLALATAVCLLPRPAGAWGFEAHRFITERAIERLPAEIRPFFEKHKGFLVEHSIDPDLWRTAGFADEPPRHYVDLDAYGVYPFHDLPREYGAAVQKWGREAIEKNGTLPWRASEIYGDLVRAFAAQMGSGPRWGADRIVFHAAVLSHYTADALVPLHAILNYDGRETGQDGVHARFESDLFTRNRHRLDLQRVELPPIAEPGAFVFDALLSSFQSAASVLEADRRALGTGREYDDAYYERFWAGAGHVLQARLARAIAGVAAMVAGAWEQAGRPALPPDARPRVERKRGTRS
jgi:hypothetical protein